jgi:hypothetical protein
MQSPKGLPNGENLKQESNPVGERISFRGAHAPSRADCGALAAISLGEKVRDPRKLSGSPTREARVLPNLRRACHQQKTFGENEFLAIKSGCHD